MQNRFVFSFEYGPMPDGVIISNWHIPAQDLDLEDHIHLIPLISFRKYKNLLSKLIHSHFNDGKENNCIKQIVPKGNHNCGHCSFCKQIQRGERLNIGGRLYTEPDFISPHLYKVIQLT